MKNKIKKNKDIQNHKKIHKIYQDNEKKTEKYLFFFLSNLISENPVILSQNYLYSFHGWFMEKIAIFNNMGGTIFSGEANYHELVVYRLLRLHF